VLAALLARRGVHPVAAGLAVGAAAWLVVDEGTALPTARQYPLVSHARGVVGHATVGLTTGVLLALTGDRAGPAREDRLGPVLRILRAPVLEGGFKDTRSRQRSALRPIFGTENGGRPSRR
jgi:hypothetical protein